MDFAYTISGFVVGFVVGLTCVGGGSLMTPILVLVFGINPAIAVGTDLLYAAITKCGGIWVHHRQGTINWHIVRIMSAGSLPASALTVWVLKHFNDRGIDYTALITSTLGIALILTSMVLLLKKQLIDFSLQERFSALRAVHSRLKAPITFVVGVFLGVLVTLSSIGAGALGAATLFLIYPRLPAISIVGTDLAHAVPLPRRLYLFVLVALAIGALIIEGKGCIHLHISPRLPACSRGKP